MRVPSLARSVLNIMLSARQTGLFFVRPVHNSHPYPPQSYALKRSNFFTTSFSFGVYLWISRGALKIKLLFSRYVPGTFFFNQLPKHFKMSGSLPLKAFYKASSCKHSGLLISAMVPSLSRAACVSCCVVISLIAPCKISDTT